MTNYLPHLIGIFFAYAIASLIIHQRRPRNFIKKLATYPDKPKEHEVYDPSQDQEKIMKGENESYFDQ